MNWNKDARIFFAGYFIYFIFYHIVSLNLSYIQIHSERERVKKRVFLSRLVPYWSLDCSVWILVTESPEFDGWMLVHRVTLCLCIQLHRHYYIRNTLNTNTCANSRLLVNTCGNSRLLVEWDTYNIRGTYNMVWWHIQNMVWWHIQYGICTMIAVKSFRAWSVLNHWLRLGFLRVVGDCSVLDEPSIPVLDDLSVLLIGFLIIVIVVAGADIRID